MRNFLIISKLLLLGFVLHFSLQVFSQVTQQWVARYEGKSFDVARTIAVDPFGNVYVTGESSQNEEISSFVIIKYDASGNEVWIRTYDGPGGRDIAVALALDATGNLYVTGYSQANEGDFDFATIKYDANGNQLWVSRHDDGGDDLPQALAIDASGNVIVTGYSIINGPVQHYHFTTVKYDAAGNQQWAKNYKSPGDDSRSNDIAADAGGNVYVTGSSLGTENGFDYATIKYSSAGEELWVSIYETSGDDEAAALAVDATGHVYVTGRSRTPLDICMDCADIATIKYDTDGNQLWVSLYNTPGSGSTSSFDQGNDIGVDDQGNVFITGEGVNAYATVKYDNNGNELWARRYTGVGGFNRAEALAIDAAGNVYVTGFSRGHLPEMPDDYATLKYDPNGKEIWVKRYNGPANGFDVAEAIAVDIAGNVYVTGGSEGIGTSFDYATIKYVQSQDVTCGTKKDKVLICHNGKVLCVASPSVKAHLKHGDKLGVCSPGNLQIIQSPNPFTSFTQFEYNLPADGRVVLQVVDATGRIVARLMDAENSAGPHRTNFSGALLPEGMYYYQLTYTAEGKTVVRNGTMVKVK